MTVPSKYYAAMADSVRDAFTEWSRFLYSDVKFNMPESELHAMAHCERVLLHALTMGAMEFGADDAEALEILAHASVFHDTRREDEYLDTGHGARAAVYYENFCRDGGGTGNGTGIAFHPESVYLMRYHDLDDREGIKAIRKAFPEKAGRVEKLYAVFKDADALDRWRLGRHGLDVRYLRTKSARTLVDTARDLVTDTMNPEILSYYDHLIDDMLRERRKEQ